MTAVLFALVFGALGAWLAYKLYKLGVFLLCFFMGFLFGAVLGLFAGGPSALAPFGVICALIAGITGVILTKPAIIISTSLSGGLITGLSLAALFGAETPSVIIVLGLLFIALGIFVQYRTNREEQSRTVQPVIYETRNPQVKVTPQTENHAQSEAISELTAGAAQALNTVKDSAVKAGSTVSEKIKTKVEQDYEVAASKAKGLSFDEVCENLEEIFFKNKALKYVMPFAEYILGLLVALSVLCALFRLYPPAIIPLACCVLVLAKRKYGMLAVSLTGLTLVNLWNNIPYFPLMNFYDKLCTLLELALYILLTVLAYRKFFASEQGISLRRKFAGVASAASAPATVIKVRCLNCGTLCDEDTAVCPACGYETQIQTVENTESHFESQSETTPKTAQNMLESESIAIEEIQQKTDIKAIEGNPKPLACPQCGYNCRSGAKFCPKCGQDLTAQDKKTSEEKQ